MISEIDPATLKEALRPLEPCPSNFAEQLSHLAEDLRRNDYDEENHAARLVLTAARSVASLQARVEELERENARLLAVKAQPGSHEALIAAGDAAHDRLRARVLAASPSTVGEDGRLEVGLDHPLAKALRPSAEAIAKIERAEQANAQGIAALRDFVVGVKDTTP